MSDIPLELFHKVFYADGNLYWKDSGLQAGTIDKSTGYKRFKFNKKMYAVHRVVWAIHQLESPQGHIDHVDGNKLNNKIENLRLCTPSQNQCNQSRTVKNRTGHKDVSFVEKLGLYRVRVSVNKKRYEFGYHKKLEDAAMVATTARIALHQEFANHE